MEGGFIDQQIQWPQEHEWQQLWLEIRNECSACGRTFIPKMVCAMDGTHIPVNKPALWERPDDYFCYKGYHSVNALVVCTLTGRWIAVVAGFLGVWHDTGIFHQPELASRR